MSIDASEDRAQRARARVGAVLRDKWQLEALLGVGGMASVFSAIHRNNGKRVAVKMLHPELSVVGQIRARFLREGYASNQVGHPSVVSVLDDDVSEDGSVFLVMELLEGENLDQRRLAAGGTLDLLEVLWAMDQVLDVLVAAHAQGIIHRDIKPENLFLTRQAALKVLDFGLARVKRPQQTQGLTRTNMLMGTLDFMAPEQARGKWDGVGAQADLWSVGATMFMLLSGHPVHEEATLDTQLKAAAGRAARSLRAVRPDLPASVITLVDRALAFEARDRWADAAAMQEAVREAYVGGGGGGTDDGTLRPPPAVDPSTMPPAPPAPPAPDDSPASFHSNVTRAWDADQALTVASSDLRPGTASDLDEDPDAPTQAIHEHDLEPLVIPPPPRLPSIPEGVDPAPSGTMPLTTGLPVAAPTAAGPVDASAPRSTRRTALIALATLPLWLLLFWGLSKAVSPTTATEPDTLPPASVTPEASAPTGQPSASAPPASASAEPPVAPPAASSAPAPATKRPPAGRPRPGGPTPLNRPPTKKR